VFIWCGLLSCTADRHEVREVGALSTTAREQAYNFEQPSERGLSNELAVGDAVWIWIHQDGFQGLSP